MRFLIYWVISAISLIISAYVAKALGFDVRVDIDHPLQLMLGVLLLGLVNATIGAIAKLFTLPLNCLTFGLVWLLINAALFLWVGQMGIGFFVGNFWSALVGSLLMGLVLGILRRFTERDEQPA
jgi:putative membrane protein